MTYVAARRFGERIIMIADTKISNDQGINRHDRDTLHVRDRADYANNYIPGRLKVFPIGLHVSLGYAGYSDVALDIVRRVTKGRNVDRDLDGLVDALRAETSDGRVDFLVASHVDGARIVKIRHGNVSADQPAHWIGDPGITPMLQASVDEIRQRYEQGGRAGSMTPDASEELAFVGGWTDLLLQAPSLTESVGGLPVTLLGSPWGHCFQMSGGVYNADASVRGDGVWLNADGEQVEQFYGQYGFSPVDSAYRGAPVLGIWFQQLSLGYVYDPLVRNEAHCHPQVELERLSRIVAQRAAELGGVRVE